MRLVPGPEHGNIDAMKTIMDRVGRLVIPKADRQEAGLRPGMLLDVRWREGRIEIEPTPLPVKLARKRRLLVAVPARGIGILTTGMVEETLRRVRRAQTAHLPQPQPPDRQPLRLAATNQLRPSRRP